MSMVCYLFVCWLMFFLFIYFLFHYCWVNCLYKDLNCKWNRLCFLTREGRYSSNLSHPTSLPRIILRQIKQGLKKKLGTTRNLFTLLSTFRCLFKNLIPFSPTLGLAQQYVLYVMRDLALTNEWWTPMDKFFTSDVLCEYDNLC